MGSRTLPTAEVLERLVGDAHVHESSSRLAALCFEVLSQGAETRTLAAPRRTVRLRAAAHGLSRRDCDTIHGNVMGVLERGPASSVEWAMIAAFAVRGLELTLVDASASSHRELVERFARHADWLELATPYAPYRFVTTLLSERSQGALIEALETGLLAPPDGPSVPAFRARAMLRIQLLSGFAQSQARVVLARAAESSPDACVTAAARQALGAEPVASTDGFELRGSVGRVPRLSWGRALKYVTGVTLVTALGRLLAYGLGLERTVRVRLEKGAVHVHRDTRLFGRTLRLSDASYALNDIECATREVSVPAFRVLASALSLGIGVVLSVIWLSDGIVRGDAELLLKAALVLAAGAALDALFAGWGRLSRARAGFEMRVDHECVLSLRKVDPERAQRLVEQISRRRP